VVYSAITAYKTHTFKLPTYLTIVSDGMQHKLDQNNGWYVDLLQKCPQHFDGDFLMTEAALAHCFQEQYGLSLRESCFPAYLESLTAGTFITRGEKEESLVSVAQALANTPELEIGAKSTAKRDKSVSYFSHYEKLDLAYAPYYGKIYGQTTEVIPPQLQGVDYVIYPRGLSLLSQVVPADCMPIAYRIIDTSLGSEYPITYMPLDLSQSIPFHTLDRLAQSAAVAKSFHNEIVHAAKNLHHYHSKALGLEHCITMLYIKLIVELYNARYEDPWQDLGACQWSGCKLLKAYQEAFKDVDYGIKVGGVLTRPSWLLASQLHTPMAEQGFGVYQVILGLLQEASNNPEVRSHWQAELTESDFADQKAMMRAIFEKPTLCYAFVADYLLTRLEKTTFSDPKMRTLSFLPPFIADEEQARQLSIMHVLFRLSVQPEDADGAKAMALFAEDMFGTAETFRLMLGMDFLFNSVPHNSLIYTLLGGETMFVILSAPGLVR